MTMVSFHLQCIVYKILIISALVPIYDARGIESHDQNTLGKLTQTNSLPLFTEGDVPKDSCVLVGYTVNNFMSPKANTKNNISCNILFVIVLGTPN
jgi:hypothetical protein